MRKEQIIFSTCLYKFIGQHHPFSSKAGPPLLQLTESCFRTMQTPVTVRSVTSASVPVSSKPSKLYFRSHQLQKQFNTTRPALTTIPIAEAAHLKKGTGVFVNLFFIGQVFFILLQLYFILGNKAGITGVHTRLSCFCPSLKSRIIMRSGCLQTARSAPVLEGEKWPIPQTVCTSLNNKESVTGKGLWKKESKKKNPFTSSPWQCFTRCRILHFCPTKLLFFGLKVCISLKLFCSRTSEHLYPHNHLLLSSLCRNSLWYKSVFHLDCP